MKPARHLRYFKQKRPGRFLIFIYLFFLVAIFLAFFLGLREWYFPEVYRQAVKKEASLYYFDPLLIASLIYTESHFGPNKVGPKGEIGLMQVMPMTLTELERSHLLKKAQIHQQDLINPEINLFVGMAYLSKLQHRIFSFPKRVAKIKSWFNEDSNLVLLHSYNAGPTFVLQNLLDQSDSLKEYEAGLLEKRPTTVKYARNILSTYQKLKWIDSLLPY
jgi:soluble lytic murein transglycosylase-like protein